MNANEIKNKNNFKYLYLHVELRDCIPLQWKVQLHNSNKKKKHINVTEIFSCNAIYDVNAVFTK